MLNLFCVPLGCSMRARFCAELRQGEYGRGVLALPNGLLLDEVRRRGDALCLSMDTLANKILNFNGHAGFRQISRRSQELVLQDMIKELLGQGKMAYFGELAAKPGFVKAVTSLVGQLSRSGATQEEIGRTLSAWGREGSAGQKDEEIALLYQYYRNFLRNKRWFDLEGKYRLAIWALKDQEARLPWQQIYFSDFYSFDSLQLKLIEALAGRCKVNVGMCWEPKLTEADKAREEFFAASRITHMELERICRASGGRLTTEAYPKDFCGSAGCRHVARGLGRRTESLPPTDDVRIYCFGEREREIRWALTQVKELLRSGVSAEKIVVAVRDLELYSGLRLIADEYGLPVTLPQTGALAVQPLSELVLLLLAAVPDNHSGAEAYLQALTSPMGHLLLRADGEAADELRQRHYFTSRSGAQSRARELLPADDEAWDLLDKFVEALPPKASVKVYGERLIAFLEDLRLESRLGGLYKKNAALLAEVAASLKTRDAVINVIRHLLDDYASCGMDEGAMNLQEWQKLLTEALRQPQSKIILQEGRQDGVLVTEVVNVQGMAFDYVYLLGLREGEFPRANTENWIYNDEERKELKDMGLDMPTTASSYAEDACFFGAAAAAARISLTLTFCRDEQAGASPYIAMVRKLFAAEDGGLLPIIEDAPKEAASAQELAQFRKRCDGGWLRGTFGEAALAAAQADARRSEEQRYNGVLRQEDLLQKLRHSLGGSFSASALEIYAQCPFRFLGERLWRQQEFTPLDEQLTPADEGDVLHQTLARFMGRYLRTKLTAYPLERLRLELEQDFADVCRQAEEREAVVAGALWRTEQPRLGRLLQQWLDFEYADQKRWTGFVPQAVEWDFSARSGKPLPLTLRDGSRVTLAGRIDRLDGDGRRVFITDYKRSAAPSGRDLAQGFDVQLPLYMLAVAELYRAAPVGGTYFVLKDGKRKSSLLLEDVGNGDLPYKPDKDGFNESWEGFQQFCRRLLTNYIEEIYAGNFAAAPRKACGQYCPLRDICRLEAALGAENRGGAADHGYV